MPPHLHVRNLAKSLLLLDHIWHHPGISRHELTQYVNWNRGTIATYVAELLEQGAIMEGEAKARQQRSYPRNVIGLYLRPDLFYSIGIKIIDSELDIQLMDATSACIARETTPLPEDHPDTINLLTQSCQRLLTRCPAQKILLATLIMTGIVDFDSGVVFSSVGFTDYHEFNIKRYLRETFGWETYLINVTHLRPVMEKLHGGAKDMEDFLVVECPGLAMGTFLNGQLYRGWQKHAGELSFTKIADWPADMSLRDGEAEAKVGIWRIRRKLIERLNQGQNLLIGTLVDDPEDIDLDVMIRAIEAGDSAVAELMTQQFEIAGDVILNTVYALNPQAVFLPAWTRRCPDCTLNVIRQKLVGYGRADWHLACQVLPSECDDELLQPTVTHLGVELRFHQLYKEHCHEASEEVYVDRIACGHSHHRHPGGHAPAGAVQGTQQGTLSHLPVQSEADRTAACSLQ